MGWRYFYYERIVQMVMYTTWYLLLRDVVDWADVKQMPVANLR